MGGVGTEMTDLLVMVFPVEQFQVGLEPVVEKAILRADGIGGDGFGLVMVPFGLKYTGGTTAL
jgi:hypothetical protein